VEDKITFVVAFTLYTYASRWVLEVLKTTDISGNSQVCSLTIPNGLTVKSPASGSSIRRQRTLQCHAWYTAGWLKAEVGGCLFKSAKAYGQCPLTVLNKIFFSRVPCTPGYEIPSQISRSLRTRMHSHLSHGNSSHILNQKSTRGLPCSYACEA
jgi:hypothetical protein